MPKPTVALVTGCFDLLHYGHFKFLEFAKSKANTLVVGLDNDIFLKKQKVPSVPFFLKKLENIV